MLGRICLSTLLLAVLVSSLVYQQASATHEAGSGQESKKESVQPNKFSLTVLSDPPILFIEGSGEYTQGTTVTTGKAPELFRGYKFVGWQVDGQWYAGNPVTIRMDKDHRAVAVYTGVQNLMPITIDTIPRVTNVIVDGTVYLSSELPLKFDWPLRTRHEITIENTEIEEGLSTRYVFDKWTDLSKEQRRIIYVEEDMNLRALFETQYYLKIISENGKTKGSGWYDKGQSVDFSVSQTEVIDENDSSHRYVFAGWDDGDYRNSPKNFITIDKPTTVKAIWKEQYWFNLTSSIPEIPVPGGGWYDKGQKVALILDQEFESDSVDTKYVFGRWASRGQFPVVISDAKSNYASITMDKPYTVEVEWKKSYLLNVVSPYGRTTGTGYYEEGTYAEVSVTSKEVVTESNKIKTVFSGWDFGKAAIGSEQKAQPGKSKQDSPLGTTGEQKAQPGKSQQDTQPGTSKQTSQNTKAMLDQNSQNTKVKVDRPMTITAKWKEQYYLDVVSTQGKVSGSGWYDKGQLANIAIEPPSVPLGQWVKHSFDRWSGDYEGNSMKANVIMDKPKAVKAEWKEDYSPGIVNTTIMAGAGIAGVMVYRRKRNNGNGSGRLSVDFGKFPFRLGEPESKSILKHISDGVKHVFPENKKRIFKMDKTFMMDKTGNFHNKKRVFRIGQELPGKDY